MRGTVLDRAVKCSRRRVRRCVGEVVERRGGVEPARGRASRRPVARRGSRSCHAGGGLAVDGGPPAGQADDADGRRLAARRTRRSRRARPARYSSRVSSSARGVGRFTRSVMPDAVVDAARARVAVAGDEPGRERGRPEAVARGDEPDAGVGGVLARVEPAHEQAHPGPDDVGQRCGRAVARTNPGRRTGRCRPSRSSSANPAPWTTSRSRSLGPRREPATGEVVVGEDVAALVAPRNSVSSTGAPTASERCRSPSASGQVDRAQVDVGVARPPRDQRAAAGRGGPAGRPARASAAGATSRVRRTMARAPSSATTGAPSAAVYQPGPEPRSTGDARRSSGPEGLGRRQVGRGPPRS